MAALVTVNLPLLSVATGPNEFMPPGFCEQAFANVMPSRGTKPPTLTFGSSFDCPLTVIVVCTLKATEGAVPLPPQPARQSAAANKIENHSSLVLSTFIVFPLIWALQAGQVCARIVPLDR